MWMVIKNYMKKGIVSLILLTLVAKVIAFGKELVLAYCYGTSEISDAYLISMVIPVTLFGFFKWDCIRIYSFVRKSSA